VGAPVLVTGGSSPLGRYVVDALVDAGERVVAYGHAPPRSDGACTAAVGELFDLPRLLQVIREHGIERIVHAAHVADPQASIQMPVATVVANVEGTLHLLEAARLAGLQSRIVLLSSTAVYGDNEGAVDESSPLRPRTPYAVTSVTGEQLGAVYGELFGLDVVTLRLGEVYGPGLSLPPAVQSLFCAAATGEPFQAPAGVDQSFHLTHGDDMCSAVLAALTADEPTRRVYNVTSGDRHSLAQIARLLAERFPNARLELGSGSLPGLDRLEALDIRAADRELDYRPRWGLARGLDDYAEWLLAQREAA
jgi:UDP-glucose 4-epimerase